MNKTIYWSAGHITAFFKIADLSQDLLYKGSLGAGFNIKRGVETEISRSSASSHQVFFQGRKLSQESVSITNYVLTELQKMFSESFPALDINYTFQVPIGAGYGTSASVALTTTFAINDFLNLGLKELSLWQIAHKAEIVNKTGLGDILGLYAKSNFEMRVQEGAPGIGKVKPIPLDVSDYDLYTASFGPLSKKSILTDPAKRKAITEIGSECLDQFQADPSFENFCSISEDFAKRIDLLPPQLWKILNEVVSTSAIKGSQIMLGESLFFFVPKEENLPSFDTFQPVKEELTGNVLVKVS